MGKIISVILLSVLAASACTNLSGCGGGQDQDSEDQKNAEFCANFVGPVAPGSICEAQRNPGN